MSAAQPSVGWEPRKRKEAQESGDAVRRVMYRHGPAVLQDPFLVGVDGDEEEVMEMEDAEVVKEVGSSSILHWNYRNFTHLPLELLGEFWWLLNLFSYTVADFQTTGVTSRRFT